MSQTHTLHIEGLTAMARDTPVLTGVDLTVHSGEVHAVMGPNGSGKSTLSHVLMGKPGYTVTGGTVTLDGVDLLQLAPWERSQAGLFLAMQYPIEVPGVSLQEVLASSEASNQNNKQITDRLKLESEAIGFDAALLDRSINVDMSGGEKKRAETLQLALLQPHIAVLDELDSGLDVDALRLVSQRVERATQQDALGAVVITHYSRLLAELKPDFVHVLANGKIVTSGGPELAEEVNTSGYAGLQSLP